MCQLCDEARQLTRLKIESNYISVIFDGRELMSITKNLFEGRSVRDYESIVEELLSNGNRKDLQLKGTLHTK